PSPRAERGELGARPRVDELVQQVAEATAVARRLGEASVLHSRAPREDHQVREQGEDHEHRCKGGERPDRRAECERAEQRRTGGERCSYPAVGGVVGHRKDPSARPVSCPGAYRAGTGEAERPCAAISEWQDGAMASENLTRDEARRRASFLSTDTYEIRLDLTTDERTFLTETTLRFRSTSAEETFLDLIAEEVTEIELNGELLTDPASRFDGARVHLPALAEGENVVRVLATGRYMNTGEGLHRFVDPVDQEVYLYTQFEVSDARRMFACFEQPDLKATYQLTVTAPAHWRVISNSPTPALTSAGQDVATWAFEPTERISTYLVALIAGNYQGGTGEVTTRDGRTIPMGVFARASLAEHVDADNVIDVTRRGIEFYEEAFDQDFPFPKYDQVFVPEYNMGAMENPGAITYVEAYVFRSEVSDATRERRDLTILHELAHMWFGDLVTMRWWDDLWLNESFAEYASTLASAEATRWTGSWTTFALSEKGWAYQQDQLPSTHPVVADMVDLEAVETN